MAKMEKQDWREFERQSSFEIAAVPNSKCLMPGIQSIRQDELKILIDTRKYIITNTEIWIKAKTVFNISDNRVFCQDNGRITIGKQQYWLRRNYSCEEGQTSGDNV